ncbi:MAG: Gliding motility-associated C-terminal protein [Mucilaginibacter sp.]|nr:Gliding motility-associated C-terminal protein [Mucilaginibacter sp.]
MLFTAGLLCLFFSSVKVKAQSDITVKNGDVVSVAPFPTTSCIYQWVNNNPAIGLPAKGSGNIPAFTAVNNGYQPIKATITGTPAPAPPFIYSYAGANYVAVLDPTTFQQVATIPVPYGNLRATGLNGDLYFGNIRDVSKLYIANPVDNTVMATIDVPAGVGGIAQSPDGKKLYVSGAQGRAITVINAITRTVESVINLNTGYNSTPIISPDSKKIYLINQTGNYISVIDATSNTITSTINVQTPKQMIFTTDGSRAYITSTSSDVLSTLNTSTGTISTVSLGVIPSQILLGYGEKNLYATSTSVTDDRITILDTQTLQISTVAAGFVGAMYINPARDIVYVFGGSAQIAVIDGAADKLITTIITYHLSFNDGYHSTGIGFAVSASGDQIYVTHATQNYYFNYNNKYMSVINTGNNLVVDSIPNGTIPPQPKTSMCSGATITFTITVNPPPPAIFPTGALSAKNTIYGTPSTSTGFSVSGTYISSGILVTPPDGFEVSTDDITFSNTVTVGTDGTVPVTQVYVRLKASASVGGHSGDIVLTSGATTATIATVLSEVTPVPLTITAGIITKAYGSVLTTGPGSIIFTSTGLKNNETIGSVTAAYGNGSAATATLGTYPGSVTLSAATGGTFTASNYTITYVKGDIEVTKAPLTITVENKTRYFGDANPPFTVKYSGFVNNEDASQLTTLPVVATTAVKLSLVGQYPITVSGASANNYDITYVPGVLTVEPQQLIVANAFTPNGDGVNDTWDIKNIAQYPNCTINIFTRYGEKVFYSSGYITAWNGKHNGANLPVGAYYYIINLNNGAKQITGSLTIIR